jgi:hypothetical protein
MATIVYLKVIPPFNANHYEYWVIKMQTLMVFKDSWDRLRDEYDGTQ